MTEADPLTALSDALAARVAACAAAVCTVSAGCHRPISAIAWQPGVLVTSEQSLPRAGSYTVRRQGGEPVSASLAGRDPTTNVAVLRAEGGAGPFTAGVPTGTGGIVLALGGDGHGGTTARVGPIELLGPAWDSQAGGRIDQLIRIGLYLPRAAEGGPVFDTRGGLLGMSTFGPRRTVLVIPAATIARAAEMILQHGRVVRGWLGVGLHPVALPRELHETAAPSGLMVLSIADGAPAARILMLGDILFAIDGKPVPTPWAVASALGPDAVGRTIALRVVRGGALLTLDIVVAARPA